MHQNGFQTSSILRIRRCLHLQPKMTEWVVCCMRTEPVDFEFGLRLPAGCRLWGILPIGRQVLSIWPMKETATGPRMSRESGIYSSTNIALKIQAAPETTILEYGSARTPGRFKSRVPAMARPATLSNHSIPRADHPFQRPV